MSHCRKRARDMPLIGGPGDTVGARRRDLSALVAGLTGVASSRGVQGVGDELTEGF